MEQNYIVIIDGFSTGKYLAPYFRKAGYQVVHVQSSPNCGAYQVSTFDSSQYQQTWMFDDNLTDLVKKLSCLAITAVIPGADSGIGLADVLSVELGLPNNGLELSQVRRDKFLMAERLKACGLAYIPHYCSPDPNKITAWAEQKNCWPVIVKPVVGAGTEGFSICDNSTALQKACHSITNSMSVLGHQQQQILCQPFIEAREYVVNIVSCDDRHYVSDIWQCNKVKLHGSMLYDSMELLPSQGEVQFQLIDYALKVIDALGVKQGPSHIEIFMTAEGPVLVELNARLMGLAISPNKLDTVLGKGNNQLGITVERYIKPKQFLDRVAASNHYQLKQTFKSMFFISPKDGVSVNEQVLQQIEQLPSFIELHMNSKENLVKTVDLLTAPGRVLLSHEDPAQVAADSAELRRLEQYLFVN